MDACAEGLRKFTTEVFDTGIALLGYAALLLWYDWRLALLCSIFPPFSYLIADKMKAVVQRTGAEYKESAGRLSAAVTIIKTLSRRCSCPMSGKLGTLWMAATSV